MDCAGKSGMAETEQGEASAIFASPRSDMSVSPTSPRVDHAGHLVECEEDVTAGPRISVLELAQLVRDGSWP